MLEAAHHVEVRAARAQLAPKWITPALGGRAVGDLFSPRPCVIESPSAQDAQAGLDARARPALLRSARRTRDRGRERCLDRDLRSSCAAQAPEQEQRGQRKKPKPCRVACIESCAGRASRARGCDALLGAWPCQTSDVYSRPWWHAWARPWRRCPPPPNKPARTPPTRKPNPKTTRTPVPSSRATWPAARPCAPRSWWSSERCCVSFHFCALDRTTH